MGGDRFIPVRSAGLDLVKHQMRNGGSNGGIFSGLENDGSLSHDPSQPEDQNTSTHTSSSSSSSSAITGASTSSMKSVADHKKDMYNSNLSSAFFGVEDLSNSRILSYQDKAPAPIGDTVNNLAILYSAASSCKVRNGNGGASSSGGSHLVARHISSEPSRVLDAPDLLDDYYLNLVDWSISNWLAIALGQTVYLWNAGTGDIEELCTFDDGPNAHISSVSWLPDGGTHLAVGTSNGYTQLWDVNECKKVRSMNGHSDRVGALSWNRHLLTSGSRDTTIVHHDVRMAQHDVATLRGTHSQEVCGLAWSPDGEMLASGANDNLLCLWDASSMSSTSSFGTSSMHRPRHCLTEHQAAVKALAWSPHERHLLASGAGTADRTIKFWNTTTGTVLNSIDTGSQVCALQWNPYEKEILSSHGFSRNQLSLYKYPSMAKIKDLYGHTSRVLYMACGPTGTVVSAAADETLRFWDVFAPPPKSSTSTSDTGGIHSLRSGRPELTSFKGTSKASWTMQIR
jgi:cell division cycle 20, cofactor of APC complex